AAETAKDPRLVELILSESSRVVRQREGLLITEHRLGYVMANAGIDQSNVGPDGGRVLLPPLDPDRSAEALRSRLSAQYGCGGAAAIAPAGGAGGRGRAGSGVPAPGGRRVWPARRGAAGAHSAARRGAPRPPASRPPPAPPAPAPPAAPPPARPPPPPLGGSP